MRLICIKEGGDNVFRKEGVILMGMRDAQFGEPLRQGEKGRNRFGAWILKTLY